MGWQKQTSLIFECSFFTLNPLNQHRDRKNGSLQKGSFHWRISRISKISRFSRISRKWSDSPLFSTVWGFSKISRISKFSRSSRKWTFLKRPLFQKTPFSEPDNRQASPKGRQRQRVPSSLGAPDATSKLPFPLWQTEARQRKRNSDVASDVCLSCSCCPCKMVLIYSRKILAKSWLNLAERGLNIG